MAESPAHFGAKWRVNDIIKLYFPHYQVKVEYQIHRLVRDGDYGQFWPSIFMQWRLDVHAIYHSCTNCGMFYDRIAVEIDTPGKNHGTKITDMHDRFRDEYLALSDGIRTVRLNTGYVWGRKKLPDDVILAELNLKKPIQTWGGGFRTDEGKFENSLKILETTTFPTAIMLNCCV